MKMRLNDKNFNSYVPRNTIGRFLQAKIVKFKIGRACCIPNVYQGAVLRIWTKEPLLGLLAYKISNKNLIPIKGYDKLNFTGKILWRTL